MTPRSTVAVWHTPDTIKDDSDPKKRFGLPTFFVDIYGYSPRELKSPTKGNRIVKESLRIIGIDPNTVTCSPFYIW